VPCAAQRCAQDDHLVVAVQSNSRWSRWLLQNLALRYGVTLLAKVDTRQMVAVTSSSNLRRVFMLVASSHSLAQVLAVAGGPFARPSSLAAATAYLLRMATHWACFLILLLDAEAFRAHYSSLHLFSTAVTVLATVAGHVSGLQPQHSILQTVLMGIKLLLQQDPRASFAKQLGLTVITFFVAPAVLGRGLANDVSAAMQVRLVHCLLSSAFSYSNMFCCIVGGWWVECLRGDLGCRAARRDCPFPRWLPSDPPATLSSPAARLASLASSDQSALLQVSYFIAISVGLAALYNMFNTTFPPPWLEAKDRGADAGSRRGGLLSSTGLSSSLLGNFAQDELPAAVSSFRDGFSGAQSWVCDRGSQLSTIHSDLRSGSAHRRHSFEALLHRERAVENGSQHGDRDSPLRALLGANVPVVALGELPCVRQWPMVADDLAHMVCRGSVDDLLRVGGKQSSTLQRDLPQPARRCTEATAQLPEGPAGVAQEVGSPFSFPQPASALNSAGGLGAWLASQGLPRARLLAAFGPGDGSVANGSRLCSGRHLPYRRTSTSEFATDKPGLQADPSAAAGVASGSLLSAGAMSTGCDIPGGPAPEGGAQLGEGDFQGVSGFYATAMRSERTARVALDELPAGCHSGEGGSQHPCSPAAAVPESATALARSSSSAPHASEAQQQSGGPQTGPLPQPVAAGDHVRSVSSILGRLRSLLSAPAAVLPWLRRRKALHVDVGNARHGSALPRGVPPGDLNRPSSALRRLATRVACAVLEAPVRFGSTITSLLAPTYDGGEVGPSAQDDPAPRDLFFAVLYTSQHVWDALPLVSTAAARGLKGPMLLAMVVYGLTFLGGLWYIRALVRRDSWVLGER
jgi:hypothetical protein